MKTTKAKVLSAFLMTMVVAAGVLAAVAMAWPQPQPRSLQQPSPQRQPAQLRQPAEELPVGGSSQATLYFPE